MQQLASLVNSSSPSMKNIAQISSHLFWLDQLSFIVFRISTLFLKLNRFISNYRWFSLLIGQYLGLVYTQTKCCDHENHPKVVPRKIKIRVLRSMGLQAQCKVKATMFFGPKIVDSPRAHHDNILFITTNVIQNRLLCSLVLQYTYFF